MLNRFLFWLSGLLPCRLIQRNPGEPYLERYLLGHVFGVTFYLHRFVSCDGDEEVHNHPWARAAAVVLKGGYSEEVVEDLMPFAGPSGCLTNTRRVRWFNYIPGNHFHRIARVDPFTWTLFMHGERQMRDGRHKGWGFLRGAPTYLNPGTVYTPHPQGNLLWHLEAPRGRDSARASLNFPPVSK